MPPLRALVRADITEPTEMDVVLDSSEEGLVVWRTKVVRRTELVGVGLRASETLDLAGADRAF